MKCPAFHATFQQEFTAALIFLVGLSAETISGKSTCPTDDSLYVRLAQLLDPLNRLSITHALLSKLLSRAERKGSLLRENGNLSGEYHGYCTLYSLGIPMRHSTFDARYMPWSHGYALTV